MVKQFEKGTIVFCNKTSENNFQNLHIGNVYIVIEENHLIDGDEYIVVVEYSNLDWHIRAKAEYFS